MRPSVLNAETLKLSGVTEDMGILPVVEALTKGYAAGRAVKKVFGGVAPSIKLPSFKNFEEWGMPI